MLDCFNRKINYLRISVTDRCNLRCTYCMPEEGVDLIAHNEILSFEEIAEFTSEAVKFGINKVRLTGGEPLVRKNIPTLVALLAKINGIKDFAMTTNGVLLNQFAQPLKEAGLHRLNVSLDTMNPEQFKKITRCGDLQQVLDGLEAAKKAGFQTIKLNCVIEKTSDEPDAQEVTKYAEKHGFIIRYIRRMNIQDGSFWPVQGGDSGECQTCNRIRLSSQGILYPCLFNDMSYSIKELGIEKAFRLAVGNKPESGHKSTNNQFYAIGG